MSQPIQTSIEITKEAKKLINDLLKEPEYVHNLLPINTFFQRILDKLQFMGGTLEPDKKETMTFPPITEFMGEKIVRPKEVVVDDLKPGEAEKAQYLQKLDNLYLQFNTIDPQSILNDYTRPEDILVLRGVAKRAGMVDYEDHEIDYDFIEEIGESIIEKEKDDQLQKNIDAQLNKNSSNVGEFQPSEKEDDVEDETEEVVEVKKLTGWSNIVTGDMEPYRVSQFDLDTNPDLVEKGVGIGDIIGIPKTFPPIAPVAPVKETLPIAAGKGQQGNQNKNKPGGNKNKR